MTAQRKDYQVTYRVIDALDAPHGGRILRLRQEGGEPLKARQLRGARMMAVAPDGEKRVVDVEGFAVFGGKASDARIARTGRVDIKIFDRSDDSARPIAFDWEIQGPAKE